MDTFEFDDGETYDKRCGEIFLTVDGKLKFHCTLCEEINKSFDLYIDHLRDQHMNQTDLYESFETESIDDINSFVSDKSDEKDVSPLSFVTEPVEEDLLIETPCVTSEDGSEKYTLKDNMSLAKENDEESTTFVPVRSVKKRSFYQLSNSAKGDRKHKCPICGLAFRSKNNMKYHCKRHFNDKDYECPICEKKFHTSTEVKLHMQVHTRERNFLCNVCGKSFTTNVQLKNHMKRHTNQRDYKCTLCDKAFFEFKVLKSHMRIHSSESPYSCEICNEKFSRKTTLKNHKKLHESENVHDCRICGKLFKQKSLLFGHMSFAHGTTSVLDSYS